MALFDDLIKYELYYRGAATGFTEATVIDHIAGRGRHKGRMGALLVQLDNGTEFSVGTGFSDAQRNKPPAIGTRITFRYQELTDSGVPRFPSYLRIAK